MNKYVRAPFNAQQIDALNRYQKLDRMHPYTCEFHDRALLPVPGGLVCTEPGCNYNQQWAHACTTTAEFVDMAEKYEVLP